MPAGRGGEDAVVMDRAPSIFDLVRTVEDVKYNPGDISKKTGLQKQDDGTWREPDDKYPEHNYSEYKGQGQKAVDFIAKNKGGQVKGAFTRSDIGDIDVVWGKVQDPIKHTGYGIAHIIDKHGFADTKIIGNVIKNGKITGQDDGKYILEWNNCRVIVATDWSRNKKNWIVTGFERDKKEGNNPSVGPVKDYIAGTSLQPSIGNIAQDAETVKLNACYMTIFDRVKGTVFDLYK